MDKERITGSSKTEAEAGEVESRMHMHVGPDDPAPRAARDHDHPDASGPIGEARNRAAGFAADTRERLLEGASKVRAEVEARTGIGAAAREHPILTIAIAFSAGILLAASTGDTTRNWIVERARRRLRAAIIGGVTAAVTHELRSLIGAEDGFGELVQTFLEGDDEEDFEI
jgi:signal transduction histidine kinase